MNVGLSPSNKIRILSEVITDDRLAHTTSRIGSVALMELPLYDIKFIPTCHISKPEDREIGKKKARKRPKSVP